MVALPYGWMHASIASWLHDFYSKASSSSLPFKQPFTTRLFALWGNAAFHLPAAMPLQSLWRALQPCDTILI